MIASLLLWATFKLLSRIALFFGLKIRLQHVLIFIGFFILYGALSWKLKKIIWPYVQTTVQIKVAVFLCISIVSIFTVWLFRDKAGRWADIIQERITPLLWLFVLFVIMAVPVVAYCTWTGGTYITGPQKITRSFIADKKNRPNIILVTFDALAARHMSVYGYDRATTPFMKKWARGSTMFTMAESSSNFTTPAAASLMTGKRVWTHQTYHIAGMKPDRSNIESLPSLLNDSGYFNTAFVVNPFASVHVLGMTNSFDVAPPASEFGAPASLFGWKFGVVDRLLYRAFGEKIRLHNWIIRNDFIFSKVINLISRNISQTTVPPENAFNRFMEMMDNNLPKPFFAWIHVFPPHDPYLPPEPFKGRHNHSSKLRSYKSQEKLIEESYKYLFQYKSYPEEMQPAVDLMRDYYDEYITYIDKQFEDFIETLDKREIENTVIILTADHGESFDHGYFTHGGPFLYEQVTHVPLIIKEPGHNKGQILDVLVEQIDIPATVLELADIQVPSWMEGRSLVPIMHGEKLPDRPAFSMNLEGNRSRGHQILNGTIAVWEGDYKLIHRLEKKESLLFNIRQDPDELIDISDKETEVSQRLLKVLLNELERANGKISTSQ